MVDTFVEAVTRNGRRMILPILDGHSTNTKNVEVLLVGGDTGVINVFMPGHTMHFLQPLDMAFLRHFKNSHFPGEIGKWLRDTSVR